MSLDERFDPHLAQAENLTTLFVAVHDGVSVCVCVCNNLPHYAWLSMRMLFYM